MTRWCASRLLELHLKLFAGLKKAVDLEYLGIQGPAVNLIVFPDGTTNVPEPKIQKQPSQTSGLQTVVDLAIGKFQIDNGLLEFSQQKTQFSARGENLRALLNYNLASAELSGQPLDRSAALEFRQEPSSRRACQSAGHD